MTSTSILEYAEAVRPRYFSASKGEKEAILDEFCRNTLYHRKSAIRLLHHPPESGAQRRGRKRQYGPAVAQALKVVWEASDHRCSKRLVPFLPDLLAALERRGEIDLSAELKQQLLALSPATMDRLLKPLRPQDLRRPHTQSPGAEVLKSRMPVRTLGDR